MSTLQTSCKKETMRWLWFGVMAISLQFIHSREFSPMRLRVRRFETHKWIEMKMGLKFNDFELIY